MIRELVQENERLKSKLQKLDTNENYSQDIEDQMKALQSRILIRDNPTDEIIASTFNSTM